MEIAAQELPPQSQANFKLELHDLFSESTNAADAQVAWLSNFAGSNLDLKKLKYQRYNNFLYVLDHTSMVREMIKQHHSAQQRKLQATKKLGDLWQLYPELQEILSDSCGCVKWKRSTAIANWTSRDPGLTKRCPNHAYVNCLTKLNRKSKVNKSYSSGVFQEAKMLLDNGCPLLEEGIDYEAMGLKSYQGLVMPFNYYPGMDDSISANRLHSISLSVPPANHGIAPADHETPPANYGTLPADHGILPAHHGIPPANHGIPVPPPSPNECQILPPPTPSTKRNETEKDGSNVGGIFDAPGQGWIWRWN